MLAIDTSSLVAYLGGDSGSDTEIVDHALKSEFAVLPPVVLTELLSDPKLRPSVAEIFSALPRLEVLPGYWERAGILRSKIIGQKRKSRLADALIAQSCIDYDIPLVTRDSDFRHYVKSGGLKIFRAVS